jgi:hypothetical protein
MRTALALSTLAAIWMACDPYSPNLGDHPFRCGTDEPRCPAHYVCVEYSSTVQLCEPEDSEAVPDAGDDSDGTPFECGADDSLEPNDSITDPTITPIPDFGPSYELVGLQVCPDTDIDVFRFRTDVVGKNVAVTVSYPSANGLLTLELLNSSGAVIRAGTASGNPDVLEATVANLAIGTYFAKVASSGAGIENDYSIEIVTSGP